VKIGITGVTGLIGRRVASLARERGHEVIGFSRSPGSVGAGCRRFDLDEPPDVTGCEAIVNLAGESVLGLWTRAKRRAIERSRVIGTRRIVEAIQAARQPPRVLVNASGIGIYRDSSDVADEGAPHGSGFLADVCEAWEAAALRARESGARVALLRTGMVLSSGGGALGAMLPVFRLGLGGKLGSGRQWVSWIHLEDQAALTLAAVENEALYGPLNATAPNPVRNVEFTRALAGAVRRPAFLRVPAFALRAVAGGFSAELLDSRRIIPAAAMQSGFVFRFPALPEALADLLAARAF
jgi:uncharacterized protein (TIGR01777 family)